MYPLDTLLYLEYIRPDSSEEAQILEGKVIVAKDFGKLNVAYNQILKVGINKKGGNENEYALGLNYEFNPELKAGLESTGNYTEDKYYFEEEEVYEQDYNSYGMPIGPGLGK